jgi:hypothetical protein
VHVDVRIADFVIRSAITDDQKHSIGRGVVEEAVTVSSAGRKPGAHSGRENLLSGIGLQCDLAFEHVAEFILSGMGMSVG